MSSKTDTKCFACHSENKTKQLLFISIHVNKASSINQAIKLAPLLFLFCFFIRRHYYLISRATQLTRQPMKMFTLRHEQVS